MKPYEHIELDVRPQTVDCLGRAVTEWLERNGVLLGTDLAEETRIELRNLANECRAKLQHVAEGIPDPKATVPSRSDDADWLT